MRTTLDLDMDILQAARELAAVKRATIGQVVSDLVRQALTPSGAATRIRNGVPVLPRRAGAATVTMQQVNDLRDA
jgi:hypothetical protein